MSGFGVLNSTEKDFAGYFFLRSCVFLLKQKKFVYVSPKQGEKWMVMLEFNSPEVMDRVLSA